MVTTNLSSLCLMNITHWQTGTKIGSLSLIPSMMTIYECRYSLRQLKSRIHSCRQLYIVLLIYESVAFGLDLITHGLPNTTECDGIS